MKNRNALNGEASLNVLYAAKAKPEIIKIAVSIFIINIASKIDSLVI